MVELIPQAKKTGENCFWHDRLTLSLSKVNLTENKKTSKSWTVQRNIKVWPLQKKLLTSSKDNGHLNLKHIWTENMAYIVPFWFAAYLHVLKEVTYKRCRLLTEQTNCRRQILCPVTPISTQKHKQQKQQIAKTRKCHYSLDFIIWCIQRTGRPGSARRFYW